MNFKPINFNGFTPIPPDWLVLTDNEADELARDYVESFAEDALIDIPEHLRYYFDDDRYVEDCLNDGRGSVLASYDGYEYEETVNGTTYYIYRQ